MAKNRHNNYKNSKAKNSSRNKEKNTVKNNHAEVPDNEGGRSGPGGN